jgi:hypothetical protein
MSVDLFEAEDKVELTQQGTVRKRKPKQANVYFTQETEDAIIDYVQSTDEVERNRIFNNHINYAFHKLAENIIHTFKFYYTEVDTIAELKHEIVCVLLDKLKLYKQDKGKAYSYFGTIVKRYLIVYNTNNYKKLKAKAEVAEVDNDKTLTAELINNNDIDLEAVDFIDMYVNHVDTNLFSYFPKEKEAKVADAILELFRKRESLDILSKKALYIYIREITETTTPTVTKVIKKLKHLYKELYEKYLTLGYTPEIL